MSQQERAEWFRLREVDFARLQEQSQCLEDFSRQAVDGLLIRQVYPAEYMREIAARIQRHEPPFYIFPPASAKGAGRRLKHLYGITLVAAERSLVEYFRVAESFRAHCRQLFEDGAPFEERMRHMLSVLAGGRPVRLPETSDGQGYMAATIRILPHGSTIDLHCDNNLGHHPTYAHLRTLCDLDNQLSYFLTISEPEEGGDLVVYRRRWSQGDDAPSTYVVSKDTALVKDCERVTLRPRPGDVILFAGGRIYHEVTETRGPRPRLTIGGFVANSLDGGALYYWS